jgi:hypothetical protein
MRSPIPIPPNEGQILIFTFFNSATTSACLRSSFAVGEAGAAFGPLCLHWLELRKKRSHLSVQTFDNAFKASGRVLLDQLPIEQLFLSKTEAH